MRRFVVRDLSPETEQGMRDLACEQGTRSKVRNRDDESFELDAGLKLRFMGSESGLCEFEVVRLRRAIMEK